MAIRWDLGALIGAGIITYMIFAIVKKSKEKTDSPLYKLFGKIKKKKEENVEDSQYYKRLPSRRGVKW